MANKTNFVHGKALYQFLVAERPDFPKEEEKILAYWEKIDAFKKQLELTKDKPRFTFYDGPPFATGLPHYGHMCAGTIKDVVCRYFSQNNRYVERRFGWDCHGLPVEYEIDKTLNIKHRNEVYAMGIDKYNEACRSIVMKYSSEWRRIIGRTGRWIDFDNDYKTLDTPFMESVWWVFKQLWEKGLVYRGSKVMPYSNGCSTVLSNFETQQNYKEVKDPAIVVTFPLLADPNTKFVAWTTTPWTLPSNLALAVNPKSTYVKVLDKSLNTHYILMKDRLVELYKDATQYEIVQELLGQELVGTEYEPLFNYYAERKAQGCFRVLGADFVTNDSGTGIVHCAPGFGDDDYKTCLKAGIIDPSDPGVPLDSAGKFLAKVKDYEGVYVKDADKLIRKALRDNGRLIKDGQIEHNYPFCWRSDTPLIYKAVSCWFIKVTSLKDDLVANNKKAYWVPQNIQEGRFNNWLEDAQDWCFSRNRFWGNPIPIWVSDDFEEQVCVGSVEELRELSGVQDITDLHKEHIDKITIPSKKGKGQLKRIEEIFDCWFESGAMPYAQQHYPFERKELFEQIFPADFIAEGIDQTRGWFYTLNVLSTALRNDTPYKNLIVNGLVLNKNGEKMSKRLKNYPDPETEIINVFGADAMRLYLINSGLVKAQSLNFSEVGVNDVVRNVFLPWYNAYRFLIQNISRYENESGKQFVFDESSLFNITNVMDRWVVSTSQSLIEFVRNEMEHYRLYTIVPRLVNFLDQFTNWYLRLNRGRCKGDNGQEDGLVSLTVLFDTLFKITLLMSPYVPFITEQFYQNLRKCLKDSPDSIHFLNIPEVKQELINKDIEEYVAKMQQVIESARMLREKNKLSFKMPVSSLTVITTDEVLIKSVNLLSKYIQEEINTASVLLEKNIDQYLQLKSEPNNALAGKELGEKFCKDLIAKIKAFNIDTIKELQTKGSIQIKVTVQREKKQDIVQQEDEKDKKKKTKKKVEYDDVELDCELFLRHVIIKETFDAEKLKNQLFSKEEGYSILLDPTQTEKLKDQHLAREITNRIQQLRKKAGLQLEDKVFIFYNFPQENALYYAFNNEFQAIQAQIKKPLLPLSKYHKLLHKITETEAEVDGLKFTLTITKEGVTVSTENLQKSYNAKQIEIITKVLALQPNLKEGFEFNLDGVLVKLGPNDYDIPK